MAANLHGQGLSPDPVPPVMHGAGGRWRVWQIVVAVVVAALLAGTAGVFIGRASKTGKEAASSQSWQPLPRAPIVGRLGPGAVWTGSEMTVWGGYARSQNVGQASDGAAYNPATRTWRAIAPAPSGVQGDGGAGAVWTGDEMVVWASNSPDGPVGGAAYDPATDSWRRLPAGPLGRREGYSSVWTGKELIVIGGTLGDTIAKPTAAALDPESGTWRLLPGLNRLTGLLPAGAVWDGREVLVKAGGCSTGTDGITSCRSIFLAYNPATDTVREITLPAPSSAFGADTAASLKPIGWTGTEVVFTAAAPGGGSVEIVRYNSTIDGWNGKQAGSCHIVDKPAQGRGCRDWSKGPYAPCFIPGGYTQAAWLGDRYVAACGKNGLQIYSLATNTWRMITPGPSPLNSREGSAIVWTGTDLIAWSGTVYERFNPTPNDGVSLRLKS